MKKRKPGLTGVHKRQTHKNSPRGQRNRITETNCVILKVNSEDTDSCPSVRKMMISKKKKEELLVATDISNCLTYRKMTQVSWRIKSPGYSLGLRSPWDDHFCLVSTVKSLGQCPCLEERLGKREGLWRQLGELALEREKMFWTHKHVINISKTSSRTVTAFRHRMEGQASCKLRISI